MPKINIHWKLCPDWLSCYNLGHDTRKTVFGVCKQHIHTVWSAPLLFPFLESIISRLATIGISNFLLVCVAEETGLSHVFSKTQKTGFVASRPILCLILTHTFALPDVWDSHLHCVHKQTVLYSVGTTAFYQSLFITCSNSLQIMGAAAPTPLQHCMYAKSIQNNKINIIEPRHEISNNFWWSQLIMIYTVFQRKYYIVKK